MKSEELLNVIDDNKIKTAIKFSLPIEITTYTLPKNMERYINDVVASYLTESHLEYVLGYVKFCLGELLTNAKKANTKRVYFHKKNLNINDKADYDVGMLTFKDDTLANIEYYLSEQKKEGYYIKVIIQKTEDSIFLEVRNNAKLTTFENAKIQDKIKSVKKYDNVQEVLTNVIDQSEGAGLGIIIVILMLQKVGMTKENYKVFTNDDETITRITLPINKDLCKKLEQISLEFTRNQELLPVSEESIIKINNLLNQKNCSDEELIDLFEKDVNLSLILLREANKVQQDCISIKEAIQILKSEDLFNVFSNENTGISIYKDSEYVQNIKEHSYNVARYSKKLLSLLKENPEITEDEIYTCGLFHDMERIFTSTISEEKKESLVNYCKENKIDDYLLNDFFNDSFHCYCGGSIAKKWNLSEKIQEVIKNHHTPENAPKKYYFATLIVYIADLMDYFDNKLIEYYQIDKKLLSMFDIFTESDLRQTIAEFKK